MITYIIKKCDLRPLDFAQKCPQNAGNAIYENQISNIFREIMPPRLPTNVSSVWPNVPGSQNLSWPPQLDRSQHATGVHQMLKFTRVCMLSHVCIVFLLGSVLGNVI